MPRSRPLPFGEGLPCRDSPFDPRVLNEPRKFRYRMHAELVGDVGAVEFYGPLMNAEFGGDLFVE